MCLSQLRETMLSYLLRIYRRIADTALRRRQSIKQVSDDVRSNQASRTFHSINNTENAQLAKPDRQNKLRKPNRRNAISREKVQRTPNQCDTAAPPALRPATTLPLLPERSDSLPERIKRYHTTAYGPICIEYLPYSEQAVPPVSHLSPLDAIETTPSTRAYPRSDSTTDYTTHYRPAVCHENIFPRRHTIYQVKRTRSIHLHEHYYYIQPIQDAEAQPRSSATSLIKI